jgi:hypothetical protein
MDALEKAEAVHEMIVDNRLLQTLRSGGTHTSKTRHIDARESSVADTGQT